MQKRKCRLRFCFEVKSFVRVSRQSPSRLGPILVNDEIGCERGYAASAANSLAQLAFFNGLLERRTMPEYPSVELAFAR